MCKKSLRFLLLSCAITTLVYIYIETPETKSFGQLQYRIWQFLIGILSYFGGSLLFSKKEINGGNSTLNEDNDKLIKEDEFPLINGTKKAHKSVQNLSIQKCKLLCLYYVLILYPAMTCRAMPSLVLSYLSLF